MADPRGAVVQDLAGGLSLVVSPKVQYCAWCCLACSSVGKRWRKGRHLLSSSAGSTKLRGEADSPGAGQPCRGTFTGWRDGRELSQVQQREMQILHLGRNNPSHQYTLG